MSNQIPSNSTANVISNITNIPLGTSSVDLMAYAESLLVREYDEQMKDMAFKIKTSSALKKAYRERKKNINEFLTRDSKDGKVKLLQAEYDFLLNRVEYQWDPSMYDGMGGVKEYINGKENLSAISNKGYTEVTTTNTSNIIAANESAEWHGDPHFNDADSKNTGFNHTDWDFQGVPGQTYNYLTDANLEMLATHEKWGNGPATVVDAVQITLHGPNESSLIKFDADDTPTINGEKMKTGITYPTADSGQALWSGKELTVYTEEGYALKLLDLGGYLNGQVKTGARGVVSDGIMPTGIIGAQFDADSIAEKMDGERFIYNALDTKNAKKEIKVEVDRIKSILENVQTQIDNLNSDTELAQTDLSTLSSQRKLAFETLSTMLSKVYEAASSVVRNLK